MVALEKTILRQLFADKTFADRCVPHVKERYFSDTAAGTVYRLFHEFYSKYHQLPAFTAIQIEIDGLSGITEQTGKDLQTVLATVQAEQALPDTQSEWLIGQTEAYCQERAVYCALQDSIQVMDDPKATRHVIPDLLKDALAVSFDTHIGHDYFDNAQNRYDFYHQLQSRVPFDLNIMNMLTKNGTPKKTLNAVMAGTNVGKSLALVHFTSAWLRMSQNVLYITCEMAEERIAERVDANMMDIPLDDVMNLPKPVYLSKVASLRKSSTGRLVIKEYAPEACNTGVIRTLLQELKMKENFVPDVLVVDYLTIMSSRRVKLSTNGVNSFSYYKYVAEELRGLCVEENLCGWTAAQFNRTGFASSDPGLEHTGESFGIPQTTDFCIALVTNDELEKLGQLHLIELKNRYSKKRSYEVHLIGVDTNRMKLYDLNSTVSAGTSGSGSVGANPQKEATGLLKRRRRLSPLDGLRTDAEEPS